MTLTTGITYPHLLGTWTISNGGSPMQALYATWSDESNEPYAGGFAMPAFDIDEPGFLDSYERGTTSWRVWWVADGTAALEADDTGLYVQADPGWASPPALSLTLGASYDAQQPARTVQPHGAFGITNLGGGDFGLTSGGRTVAVRRDDDGWRQGWNCWAVETGAPPDPSSAAFRVASGGHLPLLLLTGSGRQLTLAGVDFARDGQIRSLAGTDFSGADLRGADFSTLKDLSLKGCNFTGADLRGAALTGLDIDGATFTDAKLAGTVLAGVKTGGPQRHVIFSGADLTGADLHGLDLGGADLSRATLSQAALAGTTFSGAQLAGAHFDRCDLATTTFGTTPAWGKAPTTRTTFVGAMNLPVASLGKNWSYLDLTLAQLTGTATTPLTGLTAVGTLFPDGLDLKGVDLSGSNLTGAQLHLADLTGAVLVGCTLDRALLKGALLTTADLTSASLRGTWLIAQTSTGSGGGDSRPSAAKADGAILVNACLDQAQCNGVDFARAVFATVPAVSTTPASAQGAFLNRAAFNDAHVLAVSFRGAQLAGVNFSNAVLVASTFPSAQLTPTSETDPAPAVLSKADLRGTHFADVSDAGTTTNPANLDGADLRDCVVSTAAGRYDEKVPGRGGSVLHLTADFGATVLGTTTSDTTCPSGQPGPCP